MPSSTQNKYHPSLDILPRNRDANVPRWTSPLAVHNRDMDSPSSLTAH